MICHRATINLDRTIKINRSSMANHVQNLWLIVAFLCETGPWSWLIPINLIPFRPSLTGASGLGKSTLVNTLFKAKISRRSCSEETSEECPPPIPKTVEVKSISHGKYGLFIVFISWESVPDPFWSRRGANLRYIKGDWPIIKIIINTYLLKN